MNDYKDEIKLSNGNIIKVIPSEDVYRSRPKIIKMYLFTKDFLLENYCFRCPYCNDKSYDFSNKHCNSCLTMVKE